MDPNDTLGYMQLGNLYQLKGDHDRAIELREKAVDIAPNDFQANWGLGAALYRAGQTERAVKVLRYAERVSPRHPVSFSWQLAWGLLFAGRYEEAIETAQQASRRAPDRDVSHIQLTAAFSALGQQEEARDEAAKLLRTNPEFTVSAWKRGEPDFKDQSAVDKIGSLLVQAGLPE
jgi:adenylate cyclase